MLSSSSVMTPRATRFARNFAMAGFSPLAAAAPDQVFVPACETSTWPIAETSTPATVFFVAVR